MAPATRPTAMHEKPQIADFMALKGQRKIVCLTAYSAPMAHALDPHCDMLLVGDSVAMVIYGMDTTQNADLDMMIRHGEAVMRRRKSSLVVIDLPAGSYENNPAQALASASEIRAKTGADAVKLEGGVEMAETIAFLVKRGVPVMAHIGLTPQSINTLGGYKVQGRDAQAEAVLADAHAVAEAGAFSVVLEKVPQGLADRITAEVAIPTIGIGASAGCDGQILVVDDMLGFFTAFKPKFVKRYADLGPLAEAAISEYAADVRARRFPAPEHVFADQAPMAAKTAASKAPQKD